MVISGGGWAVGDLEGATAEALAVPGAVALVLCGHDEALAGRLLARFGRERLVTLGFTDRMPEVLQAGDVLRPLDRRADRHGGARARLPRGLLRLGGRPPAGQQRRLRPPWAGGGRRLPAGPRARAARRAGAPRRPDPSFAALPTAAAVVLEAFGAAA